MKNLVFKFYDYEFPFNVEAFENALKKYGIYYEKAEKTIKFETVIDGEGYEFNVDYIEDKIETIYISASINSSDAIKTQFNKDYECIYDYLSKREYSNKKDLSIIIEVEDRVRITVKYEKQPTRLSIHLNTSLILLTIFGPLFSIAAYLLYAYLNIEWLNILMAIVCALYMFIDSFFIFFKASNKKSILSKVFKAIVFPLAYWLIVFLVILIFNLIVNPGLPSHMSFLWAVYSMPSFALVIIVAYTIMTIIGIFA